MSRVGKKPLPIPSGVDAKVDGATVRVKGPKGELSLTVHPRVSVAVADGTLTVGVKDENYVKDRALWGLTRRLLENLVLGVTKGFEKKLEVNGIGYKVSVQGKILKLDVGFSHEVDFPIPADLAISVEKNVITVSGIDKQRVGEIASQIRRVRKPEPYKGKGIKYVEETIVRKAGKAAKAGSAA
jgi:large subunit ribosomal protein L6